MSHLFSPFSLRGLTFRNRIAVSPMCQYSAVDGVPQPWHLVHLGARAAGGAALVLAEATAVEPSGRISPADTGLWNDAQVAAWRPITAFIRSQGAIPGVQLAHAGRKASSYPPWLAAGRKNVPPGEGGWPVAGPSPLPFAEGFAVPRELTAAEVAALPGLFAAAAGRAREAGFDVVEIHAAHGYLLHSFYSPLSNHRTDAFGGPLAHRIRPLLEVARAVRAAWPVSLPVFTRISATDWLPGGWTLDDSVVLARELRAAGIDLIDVSSGGASPTASIPAEPGYQVPFAARLRREAGLPTAAVGLITTPAQAEAILSGGEADLVLLARELLRDPHWPCRAAQALGAPIPAPVQYLRAW